MNKIKYRILAAVLTVLIATTTYALARSVDELWAAIMQFASYVTMACSAIIVYLILYFLMTGDIDA